MDIEAENKIEHILYSFSSCLLILLTEHWKNVTPIKPSCLHRNMHVATAWWCTLILETTWFPSILHFIKYIIVFYQFGLIHKIKLIQHRFTEHNLRIIYLRNIISILDYWRNHNVRFP